MASIRERQHPGADVFDGTSYGAWWAVREAADSALLWKNVNDDPGLRVLIEILARTAAVLEQGEDHHDPRAALEEQARG